MIDKLREIGDLRQRWNIRESHHLKSDCWQHGNWWMSAELLYHEVASDGYDIVEENLVEIQQRLRSAEERISGWAKPASGSAMKTGGVIST